MHELTKQTQLPKKKKKPNNKEKGFFVDVTSNNLKSQSHTSTQSLIIYHQNITGLKKRKMN